MINDSGDGFNVGRSATMLKALSQDFYEYYDRVKVSVRNKGNTYGEFLRSPNGAQGDLLWSGSLGKNEMLGMGSYLELEPRSYGEMFGGVENLQNDRLYGTELEVEYELFDGSQSLGTVTEPFHVYRWVDAVGANEVFKEQGAISAFHNKLDNGLGKFTKEKEIEFFLPAGMDTTLTPTDPDLSILGTDLQALQVVKGNGKAKLTLNKDIPVVNQPQELASAILLKNGGTQIGSIAVNSKPPLLIAQANSPGMLKNGDEVVEETTLGFPFKIGDKTYGANAPFYINNNGHISFEKTNPLWDYSPHTKPLYEDRLYSPIIAPFWHDVDTTKHGQVKYTHGVSPLSPQGISLPYLEIDWEDVGYFNQQDGDTARNSFSLYMESDPGGLFPEGSGGDWVIFSYDKLEWTSAEAAAAASDSEHFEIAHAWDVPPEIGFRGSGNETLFSFGEDRPEYFSDLARYEKTHFLFRMVDGEPKLLLGYNDKNVDGTSYANRFEEDPMREELGVLRYAPEIYRVVEFYNQHLIKLYNQRKILALPPQPLDWRWIVAQVMQESNPSTFQSFTVETDPNNRRYDPLQTSNDEGVRFREDHSVLAAVKQNQSTTHTLAREGFISVAKQKVITYWPSGSESRYEVFTNTQGERIDAQTGLELGVIGLLYKTAQRNNSGIIDEWLSWSRGTEKYNGGSDQIGYQNSIRTAYEKVLNGWWGKYYEKEPWNPDLEGNPADVESLRGAWEEIGSVTWPQPQQP